MNLGDFVKDIISGQTGIVVAITDWLYGCERATVQPRETKDGKPAETFCIDVAQCEILETGAIASYNAIREEAPVVRPAGSRDNPKRASDPTR